MVWSFKMAAEDSHSEFSDLHSEEEDIENVIKNEPLFYVLGQFLSTPDGKNITTVLQDLVQELKEIKLLLSSSGRTA